MTITCKLCNGSGKQKKSGKDRACADCAGIGTIEVQYLVEASSESEKKWEPVENVVQSNVSMTFGKYCWNLLKKIKNKK